MKQIKIKSIQRFFERIQCNQKNHQGEFISHICLKADCEEQRAHCRVCNLTQHRQCVGNVYFIEQFNNQLETIEKQFTLFFEMIEQTIYKLQNLRKELDSTIMDFISKYTELPNLFNLNKVAGILHCCPQYNIEKLHLGQEQLDTLIQNNFFQNMKTSEVKSKIINENQKKNENENENKNEIEIKIEKVKENENENENEKKNENEQNKQQNIYQTQIDFEVIRGAAMWHDQGLTHFYKEEFSEALECYDQAISLNPENSAYWNNKGTALKGLNRYVESIEFFDRAIELANANPQIDQEAKIQCLLNKGITLFILEQFQNSIPLFDEVLSLDSNHSESFERKILALIHINQIDKAKQLVNQKLQANPEHCDALFLKVGFILSKEEKFEQAIEFYQLSNSIKPQAQTYLTLGRALEQLANYEGAEFSYRSALELDQNCEQAKENLEIVEKYLYQK